MTVEQVTVEELLKAGDLELVQDGNHGGNYPKVEEFVVTGVPLITGACLDYGHIDLSKASFLTEKRASKLRVGFAKAGDVLLSHKGTMGKTAIVPELKTDYVILNPQLTLYRVKEGGKLKNRYLKYFFDSKVFQDFIQRISATSTIHTLPIREQKKMQIPVLSIRDQEEIISIVGGLDDKIELNRQTNQTLEQIARAIFTSWFVDFEPVKAKIEAKAAGCDPETAAMCAISGKLEPELDQLPLEHRQQLAATAALFPDELVESELGLIPEGWEVERFGSIVSNIRESINPQAIAPDEPYVGLEHIDRQQIYLTQRGVAGDVDSNKSAFQEGDVLFGKLRPYFHKVCFVGFDGICSTDILVFRAKEDCWRGFVQCQLFDSVFVEYANVRSTGTRMPRASWKDMLAYPIAKPSDELAAIFSTMIDGFNAKAVLNVDSSRSFSGLRDSLLPKLLSGEINLNEVQAEV